MLFFKTKPCCNKNKINGNIFPLLIFARSLGGTFRIYHLAFGKIKAYQRSTNQTYANDRITVEYVNLTNNASLVLDFCNVGSINTLDMQLGTTLELK